jgi:ABC-2 type transport system ATP-binding protein
MNAALEFASATKRFGATTALDAVDLIVEPGEVRGLVGRNGAGKSTLLRLAFGLLRADHGTVTVLGRSDPGPGEALAGVGGVVDGMRWPRTMTVRSLLRMLAAYDRIASALVDGAIERLDLAGSAETRIADLSLGGVQRMAIAAAWMRAPQLLLLDEPVNGLDPGGRVRLRGLVAELAAEGAAVVIASHDLNELALTCATVTYLDGGRPRWTKPLGEIAGSAGRTVRASTADDDRALAVLAAVDGVAGTWDGDGLVLRGSPDRLEAATVALGREGLGIRSWVVESELSSALFEDGEPC